LNAVAPTVDDVKAVFGDELLDYHEIPTLSQLTACPDSFAPQWNRDYADESQVPGKEPRGRFTYYPPEGWMRYGLTVSGLFDQGNDKWLESTDDPEVWAVAYHGTCFQSVDGIMKSPLHAGTHNVYGKGIYCSPYVETAAKYAPPISLPTAEGEKLYSYVFMCRVNPRNVCNCTAAPCPEAGNPNYTLHITTNDEEDYWFVNENNGDYENIRTYGLLVREFKGPRFDE
jgi:hypothetical protein